MAYPFKQIEAKWQAYWEEHKTFRVGADLDPSKPKYYVLDMFPYPSGEGLHVGHPEGYTATDIVARYKRMRGFNVLHPMGWDAFGLPAEQYAIKTGTHPRITTERNMATFREQLKALGFSYDWDREVNTTDPELLPLDAVDLQAALRARACVSRGAARLLVPGARHDARERGGHRRQVRGRRLPVRAPAAAAVGAEDHRVRRRAARRPRRARLAGQHEGDAAQLDRPQRRRGGRLSDRGLHPDLELRVFTTRPDTLFGATYMVLAPEHALVERLTHSEQRAAVEAYREQAARKSELERTELQKEKTGVFTGAYAINPVNGEQIPIWIADYVLASYGTGAIMAVPGHDERDLEFAKTFDLPIIRTVQPPPDFAGEAYLGDGRAINSGFLNGLTRRGREGAR